MGKFRDSAMGVLRVLNAWKKRSDKKRSQKRPKKRSAGASNFPYVVARVKAMKPSLLPPDTLAKMITMDLPQITRLVGESTYRLEIDSLALKYRGADLIEHALNLNLGRTLSKIVGWSKGELHELLETYVSKYDGQNLKAVLRAKRYSAPPEELEWALIGAGQYEVGFWMQLYEKPTYEEILEGLDKTEFSEPLREVYGETDTWDNLAPYEEAIERLYFERLAAGFTGETKAKEMARSFIGKMIDAMNLKTLFTLKNEDVPAEDILKRLVVAESSFLKTDEWKKLIEAENLAACGEFLRRRSIYKHISEGLEEAIEKKSLGTLGRLLKRWARTGTGKFSYSHPLSIVPVLDFILQKQREIDNIRIIARGRELELPEKTISFLVWPE
jgi:V/A-type H+-transporting ATPase subunit C